MEDIMNEYVITYIENGKRKFEHIIAKSINDAKEKFRKSHEYNIEYCVLVKYSVNN